MTGIDVVQYGNSMSRAHKFVGDTSPKKKTNRFITKKELVQNTDAIGPPLSLLPSVIFVFLYVPNS